VRYARLAGGGPRVSRVGLGTVKFGRDRDVRYPAAFALPDDRTLRELLGAAEEAGVNLLDTAPAYGTSEERLGRLLQGRRRQWVIATKAGEEWGPGGSAFDFSARAVRASVERSLRRLRTDYLDVVLLHSGGDDLGLLRGGDGLGEGLGALRRLRDDGLVRCVGLSARTFAGADLALAECDVVMLTHNRAEPCPQALLDRAGALGRGVLVKKALGSGHLAGGGQQEAVEDALQFALSHPAVTSVVLGTIDLVHWRQNLALCERVLAGVSPAPDDSPP
jgi:aryl-alcohol dehydrogenase-like predicted oxidoreductase